MGFPPVTGCDAYRRPRVRLYVQSPACLSTYWPGADCPAGSPALFLTRPSDLAARDNRWPAAVSITSGAPAVERARVAPAAVLASGGAMEMDEDAEEAALDLIPTAYDAVARLLTEKDVGEWLYQCLAWQGERPMWLVGVKTTRPYALFAHPDDLTPVPSNTREGTYVVFDAADGEVRVTGGLDSAGAKGQPTYSSIVNLSSRSLAIAYETPEPAIPGTLSGTATPSLPSMMATLGAIGTAEAACKAAP